MKEEKRPFDLFHDKTEAIMFGYQQNAIQRMLDFDYACRRKRPSITAVVNPTRGGMHQAFWGNETIMIPIYQTLEEAVSQHPGADVLVNFASRRSAFGVTWEALDYPSIQTVVVIAEGIPEGRTREMNAKARRLKKVIVGPATVGAIKAGAFKSGNTGGTLESILEAKLHRPGHVAYVAKSGGMSNELNNIIARNTDGVYEGLALGGDRYPGSNYMDCIRRFQENPDVKMMVMLGEIGGTDEYEVVDGLKEGIITKPLIAWCMGTSSRMLSSSVQFGHAGARANSALETAHAKNEALKAAGAIVPESFNDLDEKIRETYQEMVRKGEIIPAPDVEPPPVPMDYQQALAEGLVRRKTNFISTIVDERGEELAYCGVPISRVVEEEWGLGGVIGLLWFKMELPVWARKFLETIVLITADHGPAVSGAHNSIVAARAGKDLVSSLVSGLLTIGPRFGGAVQGAAELFTEYFYGDKSPEFMIRDLKAKNVNILGIGHRIKSVTNPDMRVKLLIEYARKHIPLRETLEYALEVERLTTSKRDNLILNVDGCIAVLFCDMMRSLGYTRREVQDFVKIGGLNALFVLGRTVGLLGHVIDQKRLNQGLYRHPWDDILYMVPDKPEGGNQEP